LYRFRARRRTKMGAGACWGRPQPCNRRVVAAGGKAITMYGMRHSFASNYLIAGISDVKVSRWLGTCAVSKLWPLPVSKLWPGPMTGLLGLLPVS
jgi:site-specific recombinase XerD